MPIFIQAQFQIPTETMLLERQRNPATMSEDDLLWCFGGTFSFIDAQSKKSELTLSASLLGLAEDFSRVISQVTPGDDVTIVDREGTYALEFISKGEHVMVRKKYTSQSFDVERNQLIEALWEFFKRLSIRDLRGSQ